MIVKENATNFEPCPEYTGPGVLVDVTEPKTVQTDYGPKEKFRFAFEVPLLREDGTRFCVWSTGFSMSLSEKSNLRKFLKQMLGRDLTEDERNGFDLETLIGTPVSLVVVHTEKDGNTYANIAACVPYKGTEPIEPSGQFIRQRDRDKAEGKQAAAPAGKAAPAKRDSTFQRTAAPAAAAPARGTRPAAPAIATAATPAAAGGEWDWASTKVHTGRFAGTELREMSIEAIDALVAGWLPKAKAVAKPLKADRDLMAALEAYQAEKAATAREAAEAAAAAAGAGDGGGSAVPEDDDVNW